MLVGSARRAVAGLSVFAVAAGFAVAGLGVAGAASAEVTWSGYDYDFVRTINNATPVVGETVTMKTVFKRTAPVEYIQQVKDVHPECLTYVPDTAKVDGKAIGSSEVEVKADYTKVSGNWAIYNQSSLLNPKSRTFEFSYTVGADCARETPLMTTMHFAGSDPTNAVFQDKGPAIAVAKNVSTTTLASIGGAQVGVAKTLSATVIGGADGDPVDFYNGATKIGSGTLAAGVATFDWTPNARGTQSISAKFEGTTKAVSSSSPSQNVAVTQADSTSTLTIAEISGAQVGKATELKATVSPAGAGGTVTFKLGDINLATVNVSGTGEAVYPTWIPTTAGSQTIGIAFSGRDGVGPTNASVTVLVAEAPANTTESTTVLTADDGKVGVAQNISAHVTPAGAGGTLTFKDGDTVLGTAPVDSAGNASISWTPTVEGQRTIRAEYTGVGLVGASVDEMKVQVAQADAGGGDGGGDSSGSLGSLGNIFGS